MIMSEALKKGFFDMLEDDFDIKRADEAYASFQKNPASSPIKNFLFGLLRSAIAGRFIVRD
jgi:hypothetical protein